jgi:cob(I)alamin adenosyltransferase
MKIYTGGGDRGKTGLFSGERVSKSHERVEAYGDVDELNSTLGVVSALLPEGCPGIRQQIARIQSDLLHVGAWIATTPGTSREAALVEFTVERVQFLESAVDRMEENLRPLHGFILPQGHLSSAMTQFARTVCRRAERRVVRLFEERAFDSFADSRRHLLVYLNRLSDFIFVLARHLNHLTGISEVLWNPESAHPEEPNGKTGVHS